MLEIGTGWGGMALHAAKHYGCRVTTTTISEEQFKLARERVAQEGLADRIVVLKQDYRELSGSYDKIVSIEMVEAVGYRYYDEFFTSLFAAVEIVGPDVNAGDYHLRSALRAREGQVGFYP